MNRQRSPSSLDNVSLSLTGAANKSMFTAFATPKPYRKSRPPRDCIVVAVAWSTTIILCFNKPRATNSKNGARHCSFKSNRFGQDNIAVSRARRQKITVLCPFDAAAFSCASFPLCPMLQSFCDSRQLRRAGSVFISHFIIPPAATTPRTHLLFTIKVR